jgi:hypothetical protein
MFCEYVTSNHHYSAHAFGQRVPDRLTYVIFFLLYQQNRSQTSKDMKAVLIKDFCELGKGLGVVLIVAFC